MPDNELLQAILKGNKEAFRRLVEQFRSNVVRIAMGFVHNKDDAEDIAQDVFVKIFQTISNFKGNASLSTWIYRITVNTSLNYIRDHKRQKLLYRLESLVSFGKLKESDKTPKDFSDPEKLLSDSQDAKFLHQAINTLSENQRIAFTLNKYDDLSYQEIADVMNLTLSSVESLIHRAKKDLQKKLFRFYRK
jgi:RNA polymerase sigma-70 factor (ECF subfamily)